MFGHILIFAFILIAPSESKDVENILGCTIVPLNHVNSTCVNTDLTSFSFSTKITAIDLGETRAARITNLFLASAYMYYVPSNIFKFFPNVSEIGIHTALPQLINIEKQHFIGLAKLLKLFIVGQRLRHIGPNVFEGAPAITDLFLPSNQIQSINELAFNGLAECRHLMLNGNQIDKLTSGTFAPMPKLWSLNLSKNRLMYITEYTLASNKVTVFDLSYNKIESIPENVVTNFMNSKEPKKLLSMKGNICDNRIYTKNSHRLERLLNNCVKGSDFLPERELIERLREDIRALEEKNAKLELENHKLNAENERINSELTKLQTSASCNEEKCHILLNHMWQSPFNAVKNIIPQIHYWKEKSQTLFTTLATIHGDGTCINETPNVTRNDCTDQNQLDLITSVEDRVLSLMKAMKALQNQNVALNNLVHEISSNPVICPPIEECPEPEPQIICEICPETTTLGSFYCPDIVCPPIQCPPIKCPPCYGIKTTTTEPQSTLQEMDSSYECMQTVETLEGEMIELRAINNTYHRKTFKASCSVEMEIEELDRIVLEQSVELEETKKTVKDLTESLVKLRKEAESVERISQQRLADNFDLKENYADCTSLRQIDLIETISKMSETLLSEKNRMLDKVVVELKKFINDGGILRRRLDDGEFDFRHLAFEEVTQIALVEQKKDLKEALKTLLMTVKMKYQQLKEGDARIQKLVGELANLVALAGSSMIRRGMIADKIDQTNQVIIQTVSTLESLLQAQFDMMRKTSEEINKLLTSSVSKIWSIFSSRRVASDDAKAAILQPLSGLNKTLIDKDNLLLTQYNKIEKYIVEIKDSRIELEQGVFFEFYLTYLTFNNE